MTQIDRTQLEKDVLYACHVAERDEVQHRAALEMLGEKLVSLGLALQQHPELVTSLPDPSSAYDYREELNALRSRDEILALCKEVGVYEQKRKAAENRRLAFRL